MPCESVVSDRHGRVPLSHGLLQTQKAANQWWLADLHLC